MKLMFSAGSPIEETVLVTLPAGVVIPYDGSYDDIAGLEGWDYFSALFIKGAASGELTKVEQSADTHTHTIPSTSTSSTHTHSYSGNSGYSSSNKGYYPTPNAYVSGGATHRHTLSGTSASGGSHAHTTDTSSAASHLPPYVTFPWIKANTEASVPLSALLFYKSLTIPSGFTLRSFSSAAFVRGGTTYNASILGGASHSHTFDINSAGSHIHSLALSVGSAGGNVEKASTYSTNPVAKGNHTHGNASGNVVSNGSHNHGGTGSTESVSTLPSYVNLAGIKVDGATLIPSGVIVAYDGAVIPSGWVLCDGANGSPDLRNKFIRLISSGTILATGGATTHTHNCNSTGADGSHTHNFYFNTGSPNGDVDVTDGTGAYANTSTHNHSADGATGSAGSHIHSIGTTGTGTNEPAHIRLYYIMKT